MSEQTATCMDTILDEVLGRYPARPSSLIAVLQDLQEALNFLPPVALNRVASALHVPRSQVYHVATFYKAFSLTPRGKHLVSICRGTACHVQGDEKVADMLHAELGIRDGETSADGEFTLQSVRCLGCCSLAPVIMIDREVFGNLTAAALRRALAQYRDDMTS
ncbi:MAG: NADP-reducing hydrogenase subunit HndA [bacterium ADurb.Bin429]|nr:MAG: NADP-reducing hydrogenase subunit HndA [bacterium ADurb.Bin429]